MFYFFYSTGDLAWRPVGPALDATLLSDDRVIENGAWGFTGCFIALCAQDSSDSGIPADFDHFNYAVGTGQEFGADGLAAAPASTDPLSPTT